MRLAPRTSLLLLACMLPLLAGCGPSGGSASGRQRAPMLDLPPANEYTPEELATLGALAAEHPLLARKLVNQGQALRAAGETYNAWAWNHNAKMLRELGYTEPEIAKLLGAQPGKKPEPPESGAPHEAPAQP
ncbi:MAG: hypothetical protein M5U26_08415 [Planctomycetota bacterium]|nr:hypothetical protein [Planctomycetota bacterium]